MFLLDLYSIFSCVLGNLLRKTDVISLKIMISKQQKKVPKSPLSHLLRLKLLTVNVKWVKKTEHILHYLHRRETLQHRI